MEEKVDLNKNNEKIRETGIVHFWDLPGKIYVILDAEFKNRLIEDFMKVSRSKYNANKLTGIQRKTISNIINKMTPTIRIGYLLKILEVINKEEFKLLNIEKHIKWIGDFKSKGIMNPKLPFNFNSREGARFLAAICNDGWISDGAYYSNLEQDLRTSVKKDAISIFGGNERAISECANDNDRFLRFPSIVRDVLIFLTDFKGVKSENNPSIPSFILKDEELILGWIEQTIADEGHVKYYPETYRREIVWRRAFSKNLNIYKLNRDELTLLDKIGIKYDLKNIGTYRTNKNIEKIILQLRIAKRENLLKLRKLIRIPHKKKDKTLTEISNGFVRYKEPLKIKDTIIKICKENSYVSSSDLKKELNYKKIETANKWLKFYSKNGLVKCIKEFAYGEGFVGRIPAKYTLKQT